MIRLDYRDFIIEVFTNSIMMSTELSPDPYEDKWFTEELFLNKGVSQEEAVAKAKDWIDDFYLINDVSEGEDSEW